jgi:hypothetical protein
MSAGADISSRDREVIRTRDFPLERYLDTEQASAYLRERGVNAAPSTLRRMRSRSVGGGPAFYRVGGRGPVRYRADDLVAWVEQRRVDPPARPGDAP